MGWISKCSNTNGFNFITKIESISVKEIKPNGDLVVVTASDNGISVFFRNKTQ